MNDVTPRMFIAARGHNPRWGTATLESKAIVTLYVGGDSKEPLHLCLINQLILGRSEVQHQYPYINLAAHGAIEQGVSHKHAALELRNSIVMLTDLSSTNGTFLNGQQLSPNQPSIVRSSDEIRLGQLLMYIYYEKNRVSILAEP